MPLSPAGWDDWVMAELEGIRAADRWRSLTQLDGVGPELVTVRGEKLVSFASNDYLGLAGHPAVIDAARDALGRWGTGSTSSRLIVGDRTVHHDLEADLAEWKGAEAALVFPTGYQANVSVLTVLGGGARIVSDELNHASIIDGARLARAEVAVYRHCDVDHARDLVDSAPGRALVVTDSVFSMDGDVAPLTELSSMCSCTGAFLVVDDAHAVFPIPPVDPAAACVRVGTLSKTLGSQGGFVTGGRPWIDLLVNRGRSFIFTTGLAPPSAAAARAGVEIVRSDEGRALLATLRCHVDAVRPGHPSPVVPVVLGDESAALAASDHLRRLGLLVPAIRPPTVPVGASRLRVSLSAAHDTGDVERLVDALAVLN